MKENIQAIIFDEKTNTVTISGPFDPKKVIKKLCCNACEVIKDIQVKDEKPKEKPKDAKPAAEPVKDKPKDAKPDVEPAKDNKPKDEKPKDQSKDAKPADEPKKDKPKDAKPADEPKDKPKDAKPAAEPAKDKSKDDKPKDAKLADEPKEDKPKDAKPGAGAVEDKPKDAEPQKDKPKALESYMPASQPGFVGVHEPRFGYQPVWGGPVCGCGGRHYDGYYGNNRGCWCGKGCGWAPGGPMGPSGLPPVVYGQPVYGGYMTHNNYFSEGDAESCNIM